VVDFFLRGVWPSVIKDHATCDLFCVVNATLRSEKSMCFELSDGELGSCGFERLKNAKWKWVVF
jgi:hypothetical protein